MRRAPETVRAIIQDIQSSLLKWYIPNCSSLGRSNEISLSATVASTVFQTCLAKASRQVKRSKKASTATASFQQRFRKTCP
jgi:hypothetical protein